MAAGLRRFCLLIALLPLALADTELPCEGFQVVEGFGFAMMEDSPPLGVKVLKLIDDVEADETCWKECCHTETCDLAFTTAERKCYVIRCKVKEFDMSELTAQVGARTYRKEDIGVKPQREDFCLPKNDSGSCRASFPRWWYDAETGTCKNFTYGGCPANLNNHAGEEECMKKCSGVTAKTVDNPPAPQRQVADLQVDDSEKCSGPAVVGVCRASFPRWFFDSDTQTCKQFTYGGCGGNNNRHLSEQECADKCIDKKQLTPKGSFKEYCAAPAHTGKCRASFRRFYYDPSEGKCKPFVYGGCSANKNNYMKEEDCLQMCSGRSENDDHDAEHNAFHRPLTSVILPIFLTILAAFLLGVMIVFFVKVARNNQRDSNFRALWNPIDDKECLMNNAYTL